MIWVDADATPRAVKEMLYRAAQRRGIQLVLVANSWLQIPKSPQIRLEVVGKGFDVADEYIAENVSSGDLVISADIPLAAAVVERGAVCLDPRGNVIDATNANARLAMRDFMETMRESGEAVGGPKAYSDKDKHRFAAALDRWLATGRVG
ncbi:MAG: YaiI/YqxD family protein [Alphaproteobacteria bacterium]|nr:YaiI/YqxD family protein [Alphaproteobacteria bacterium]